MYYEYRCPVGIKSGKHRHRISGDKLKALPKCYYCGAEMVMVATGTAGHYENSTATGDKWVDVGPVKADERRLDAKLQAKAEAKAAKGKGKQTDGKKGKVVKMPEKSMLDVFENPSDQLKDDIERMAGNA